MTCGLGGEKSTVNQAINLSLVDSFVETTVYVSRNQIKSINKTLSCVFAALFSVHVSVLGKPHPVTSVLDASQRQGEAQTGLRVTRKGKRIHPYPACIEF